ncbi:MAG: ATP-binding cassette domain-containing protein [Cyclobacteriaceae bacterium]|nr:ATP-binding cassette domain-containing protein [Cyclobacteriaceae bacterium]
MNVLEFDSLHLEFGMRRVLSSIYMKCETGKITALLGRNGSGKSCLMKIVFGSMSAEHKSIRINGVPLIGNHLSKQLISYLPQGHFIPDFISIRKAFELFQVRTDVIQDSFADIQDLSTKKAGELSFGQLRLLEVCLMLYSPHPFCILDEPFSGMAPLQIEKLQTLIKAASIHKGILITDHLHEQVRSIADNVYVLSNGATHLIKEREELVRFGYLST